MENMNLFKKYKSRLVVEAALKSAMCGLVVGFGINFVTALVTWLCGFEAGIWLAIGLGVGAAAISGVIFYFVKFRPEDKDVARRVDALGLEERMITMLELDEDDSYIARRQREDAAVHAASTGSSLIKIKVSGAMIAVASVTVACGVAMTTVQGLTLGGVVPGFDDLLNPPNEQFIEITYVANEGGFIDGEESQLVVLGEDPTPVMAMADDGWMFIGWDDGLDEPYREDPGLASDYTVTALFEKIDGEGEGPGGEGDEPGDGEGGEPTDKPGDGEGGGEGGEGQEGGSDGNGGGDGEGGDKTGKPSEGGKGDGAGGQFSPDNQAVDGNTYYRDVFDEYYQNGIEYVTSDKNLTPEEREAIEKYLNSLK